MKNEKLATELNKMNRTEKEKLLKLLLTLEMQEKSNNQGLVAFSPLIDD